MNRILLYTATAACLVLFTGCVNPSAHRRVLADRDRLEADNATLSRKNKELEEESSRRAGSIKEDRARLSELEGRAARLDSDIKLLSEQNLRLANEFDEMNKRNRDLLDRLESLSLENESLNKTVGALKEQLSEKSRLEDQATALTLASKELSDELEHYRSIARRSDEERRRRQTAVDDMGSRLRRAFKEEIDSSEIAVTTGRESLTVRLTEPLLFRQGGVELSPDGKSVLDRLGDLISGAGVFRIEVEGHTDNVPLGPQGAEHFSTNWELSAARAGRVTRHMEETNGIDRAQLVLIGRADTRPIEGNETPEGRQANRRIEINLVPISSGPDVPPEAPGAEPE